MLQWKFKMTYLRLSIVILIILLRPSNAEAVESGFKDELHRTFYLSFDDQLSVDNSAGAGDIKVVSEQRDVVLMLLRVAGD
jgi:hypothetical protein